jgi:hypothetical protein
MQLLLIEGHPHPAGAADLGTACADDLQGLADTLGASKGDTLFLRGADAATPTKALEALARGVDESSAQPLVVAYSGHGQAIERDHVDLPALDDDETTVEAMVMWPDPTSALPHHRNGWLLDDELVAGLSGKKRGVVMIIDACHAQGVMLLTGPDLSSCFELLTGDVDIEDRFPTLEDSGRLGGTSIVYAASCKDGERSFTNSSQSGTAFLTELRTAFAENPIATWAQALAFAQCALPKEGSSPRQHPIYKRHGKAAPQLLSIKPASH